MFYMNGETFEGKKICGICEENITPYLVSKDGKCLFFYGADRTIVKIKDYIKKLCSESRIVWQEMTLGITD